MYCWLKRRGEGRVFYLYFAKGVGQKPYSLRTSDRALARQIQRRLEEELARGTHGLTPKLERVTYSELVKRFIESRQAKGISEGSLKTYLVTLNLFGSFLGVDLPIHSIKPEQIDAFIAQRRTATTKHGTPLKPKSLRNEVFQLASLFAWATKRDLLAKNPMDKVEKPRRVVYDNPKALTQEEYMRLKEALTHNEEFADLVDFYLLTGIRRSDGLQITSECFDFENMTVTLPQHKQQNHKALPLSAELAAVAKRIIERVGIGRPFVQVKPGALTLAFRRARIRAGLPAAITFHSLRHSFTSWLAQAGVDFKTLQSLTGHSSSQALEVYLHSFDPNRKSAIEKLQLPMRKAANG